MTRKESNKQSTMTHDTITQINYLLFSKLDVGRASMDWKLKGLMRDPFASLLPLHNDQNIISYDYQNQKCGRFTLSILWKNCYKWAFGTDAPSRLWASAGRFLYSRFARNESFTLSEEIDLVTGFGIFFDGQTGTVWKYSKFFPLNPLW